MANTNLECAAMMRSMITSNMHGCMEDIFDKKSCERYCEIFICIEKGRRHEGATCIEYRKILRS